VLIILPGHLQVSGVTTWGMRAISGLRSRGIPAGLVVHVAPGEAVPRFLEPYVVGVVRDATPIESLEGQLDELIPVYLDAIRSLFAQAGRPVVVSPNLHGDCYGAVAAIARSHPHLIRTVAWIHSDNGYDIAVGRHYEQMIHRFVGVSSELCGICRRSIPSRASDVVHLPHGVEVDEVCPVRETSKNRPIHLVYTGRIEEHQKRISTLPHLSRQLSTRGIEHQLRIIGDGPAMNALCDESDSINEIELLGALAPDEVDRHLRWGDAWVLPSRFEGQSVAMLEAMAQGCIPIVTAVRSGAKDAVVHGQTGMRVEAQTDTPTEVIGERMSASIAKLLTLDTQQMARNAHQHIVKHHRTRCHIDALVGLINQLIDEPKRTWASVKPTAYSAQRGALGGSTPDDAPDRMKKCLGSLGGHRVLIFGSGQHTINLGSIIRRSPATIIGIVDDDPQRIGTTILGWPIYAPDSIGDLDATDLVISSWIHEESIWARRGSFEARGLRVHRLYQHDAVGAES